MYMKKNSSCVILFIYFMNGENELQFYAVLRMKCIYVTACSDIEIYLYKSCMESYSE